MDLRSEALKIVRESVKEDEGDSVEILEDRLPALVWMYRNGIDREDVIAKLDRLVTEFRSVKAARTVIELKIGAKSGEYEGTMADIQGMTNGKTAK